MPVNNYISFSVDQKSIASCIAQIDRIGAMKQAEVRDAVAESTLIIETGAKRSAPVAGKGKFGGFLRARIFSMIRGDGFGGRVWSAVPYAPFQEFGTGIFVDVPAGWEEVAMQFKGKGIRQVNIRALHYLFFAWEREMQHFQTRLKNIFGVKS